ncbi:MAG: hypothetical protein E6G83_06765 [Alphaproteobacteria bacterium]|nr:MAG: hypothetical protein E6G83_06765 [Alphaproteobacteria bacterium]
MTQIYIISGTASRYKSERLAQPAWLVAIPGLTGQLSAAPRLVPKAAVAGATIRAVAAARLVAVSEQPNIPAGLVARQAGRTPIPDRAVAARPGRTVMAGPAAV